jgi:hydroxymethylpyrimidine/phosphomethylpyrimidine kinase
MSVITAITAQNTMGVSSIREMDADIVRDQINCLFDDIKIEAVKIGMVSSIETIDTIAECLINRGAANIVLDPVMVSKSGCRLFKPESRDELIKKLFPLADVITPNLFEAEVITGDIIKSVTDMEKAAVKIHGFGARNVVVKGGCLTSDAVDVMYDGTNFSYLKTSRVNTKNTHGTGCTFSSAITAYIARGYTVSEAVKEAKEYIQEAIENAIELGHGVGPTNHFINLYRKAGVSID